MSRWTHNICATCWKKREPERTPVVLTHPPEVICCFCGRPTKDGIFVREDGEKLKCHGTC